MNFSFCSHFATNIKFLRETNGLSQEELSSSLGLTRAKIASYEISHTKNPSIKDLNTITEYFAISIDTLLKLDLSKLPDYKLRLLKDEKLTGASLRIIVTTVTSNNKEKIEYVPIKARAGYLTGYADPDFISKLPTFDLPHLSKEIKYRMFSTEGDSMFPIPEGALIVGEYIDDWLNFKGGQLCIVVTKTEGIVFKQIENYIKDEGKLVLSSLNPRYEAYTVLAEDILEMWKFKCYISDFIPSNDYGSEHHLYEEIKDLKKDIKRILNIVNV